MSEIKNDMLGLYGTEHSKCNYIMTLGFKGLKNQFDCALFQEGDTSANFGEKVE